MYYIQFAYGVEFKPYFQCYRITCYFTHSSMWYILQSNTMQHTQH